METITCAACGRDQISTNRYCEMCGKECAPAQPAAAPAQAAMPTAQPIQRPEPVNSSFLGVDFAAQDALNKARSFGSINRIILILGIIGSVFLMFASIVPVCPPIEPECWSSDKELYNFGTFFPTGLASLLSVLWLNGIAQTIATRAVLAAEVAKASGK